MSFVLLVPGRHVIDELEVIDSSSCGIDIEFPQTISEIVLSLLPTSPVPEGCGAVLYYSLPPYDENNTLDNFQVLGAVTWEKPSGIFRTAFNTLENIASLASVRFIINIESEESIKNLELENYGVEERVFFAKKIAENLFSFMTSFSQPLQNFLASHNATGNFLGGSSYSSNGGFHQGINTMGHSSVQNGNEELMVIPTNILDKWLTKFENKFRLDPNFYLK